MKALMECFLFAADPDRRLGGRRFAHDGEIV
jgi:hypothetical protein